MNPSTPTIGTVTYQWRELLIHPHFRWLGVITIVPIVLSLGIVAWSWKMLPTTIPLWYSRAWGEDQLAHPFWLLVLPVGSLLWFGISLSLAATISQSSAFAKFLMLSSMLVSALSFITLLQIVLLIT